MKRWFASLILTVSLGAQTRSVTDFVEWALGVRLTPAERAELRRLPFDAATVESLLKAQADVGALPVEQQEPIRLLVQAKLVEALRGPKADDTSRMLLAAYERGHRQTAGVPPQMVGTWSSVSTSTVTYRTGTGSHAPPSGEGTTWHISADGSFRSESLLQSSLYNCTMTVFVTETGAVRADASSVVFDSVGGPMESKDNCNREFNYRKTIPARQYAYTWRLTRDQWGQRLCLAEAGKTEECFSRKRD